MRVTVNGESRELSPGTTLAAVIAALPGPADGRGMAAAVDGEVVPRRSWASTELIDGARVEVVVAVQGG
jgi:sulfur carrier protein